jgi:hypothetical protein
MAWGFFRSPAWPALGFREPVMAWGLLEKVETLDKVYFTRSFRAARAPARFWQAAGEEAVLSSGGQ